MKRNLKANKKKDSLRSLEKLYSSINEKGTDQAGKLSAAMNNYIGLLFAFPNWQQPVQDGSVCSETLLIYINI